MVPNIPSRLLFLLSGTLIACCGCSLMEPNDGAEAVSIELTDFIQGGNSKIRDNRIVLVRDKDEFELLANEFDDSDIVTDPPDLSNKNLVAFFLGNTPSLGYSVRIAGIAVGETIKILVQVQLPGEGGCEYPAMVGSPFHWVIVDPLPWWRPLEQKVVFTKSDPC